MSRKLAKKIATLLLNETPPLTVHLYVDVHLDQMRLLVKYADVDFDIKVADNSRSDTCATWIKKIKKEFRI